MTSRSPARLHPRMIPALLALLSLWGLAGWWAMLSPGAPAWTRMIPMPIALLAAILLWLLSFRRLRRAQNIFLIIIIAGLIAGFWRDAGGGQRNIAAPDAETLRITQWTQATDQPQQSVLAALLGEDPPHILILTRPTLSQMDRSQRRKLQLRSVIAGGQTFLFSRYPLRQLDGPSLPGTKTLLAEVTAPRGIVHLLALDAGDQPMSPPAIAALAEWSATRPAEIPLVIAGGQNRSRTDAAWKPLRQWLRPAYEAAGYGWPYSWPSPVPLFSRDDIWVTRNLDVLAAAYRSSSHAQHLRQRISLAWPDSP